MKNCILCDGEVGEFVYLGQQPIANAFLKKEDLGKNEFMFHLGAGICKECKMSQLVETIPKERLFNENYAYFSSVSQTMEKHFKKFSDELISTYLKAGDLVVEVGSNDGIMLKNFDTNKFKVVGVEPALNVAEVSRKKGLEVISEFFDEKVANRILQEKGKAKVIYAANVINHIEPLPELAKGVVALLDGKGIFVFEDPYLVDIVENNAYDQIYDEHVWFFSVKPLSIFLEKYGLEIFDVKHQPTQGGSMRYYICKKGSYPINNRVSEALENESIKGTYSFESLKKFGKEVEKSKVMLVKKLTELKSEGKRIFGYGASAKGTVVLNYCGIGSDIIEYITDTTPTKQGLYNPGKHIPIVSPKILKEDAPDYALLLVWNYAEEIKEKEKGSGLKFIVHIPYAKEL